MPERSMRTASSVPSSDALAGRSSTRSSATSTRPRFGRCWWRSSSGSAPTRTSRITSSKRCGGSRVHDALMRIGINGSSLIAMGAPLAQMVDHAVEAEEAGFSSYWLAQLAVPDALTAIAMMGARTSTIELGTAVIPTWLRHPLMLAGQALTVQEAIGNRLVLGIGLAHKPTIEGTLKVPFATPAKHMEEYLSVL